MTQHTAWRQQIDDVGTVTSTMEVARDRAAAGAPHGTTVVARAQTLGRGRHGQSWASAADAGLYVTVVLRAPMARDVRPLTLVFGAAVLAWVHQLGVTQAQIKWPNDVLVGDGKLAGLLMEVLADGADDGTTLLLGVGVNVAGRNEAHAQLAPAYVGLQQFGLDAAAAGLVPQLVDALQHGYHAWLQVGMAPTLAIFAAHHALAHRPVRAQAADGSAIFGTVQGVAPDGGLVLATCDGEHTVYAGDVGRVRTVAEPC